MTTELCCSPRCLAAAAVLACRSVISLRSIPAGGQLDSQVANKILDKSSREKRGWHEVEKGRLLLGKT